MTSSLVGSEMCIRDSQLKVLDSSDRDITAMWKAYHELLSNVLWWGLIDQCPPAITVGPYDPSRNCINVKVPM
eukprot:7470835-Prorocentrum_lima.AAC.1